MSVVGEALGFVAWSLMLGIPLVFAGGYACAHFIWSRAAGFDSTGGHFIPAHRTAGVDPMTAFAI